MPPRRDQARRRRAAPPPATRQQARDRRDGTHPETYTRDHFRSVGQPWALGSLLPPMRHQFPRTLSAQQLKFDLDHELGHIMTSRPKTSQRNIQFLLCPRQRLEMDLCVMQRSFFPWLNAKYLLVLIDGFSKFTDALPLQEKSSKAVMTAFKTLWRRFGATRGYRKPITVASDRGSEFLNRRMKHLYRTFKIRHQLCDMLLHAPHVENVLKTLQKLIKKFMLTYQTPYWVQALPFILKNYNERKSSTFQYRLSPSEVDGNPSLWRQARFHREAKVMTFFRSRGTRAQLRRPKPQFQVNDVVRIVLESGPFSKSHDVRVSEEKYVIHRIRQSPQLHPIYQVRAYDERDPLPFWLYGFEMVRDRSGLFRIERILQRRRAANGRMRVKVKFMGYPDPSWLWEEQVQSLTEDGGQDGAAAAGHQDRRRQGAATAAT